MSSTPRVLGYVSSIFPPVGPLDLVGNVCIWDFHFALSRLFPLLLPLLRTSLPSPISLPSVWYIRLISQVLFMEIPMPTFSFSTIYGLDLILNIVNLCV